MAPSLVFEAVVLVAVVIGEVVRWVVVGGRVVEFAKPISRTPVPSTLGVSLECSVVLWSEWLTVELEGAWPR